MFLLRPEGQTPEIVEVKVPRSTRDFKDGLTEVSQYAQAEGVTDAYYVVFDHCADLDSPRFMETAVSTREIGGVSIHCIRVRVAQNSPSRVGRACRKRAKTR